MSGDSDNTQASVIYKVQGDPLNNDHWTRFMRVYDPAIRRWLGGKRLQPTDVDDIAQEVLIRLVKKLPAFTYDPARSFRAWLKTVVRNVWLDVVGSSRWKANLSAGGLTELPDESDLPAAIAKEYDQELLEWAMTGVKGRVAPVTWESFERTAVGRESPRAVADDLGIGVGQVYVHKSRVTKLIGEAIREADGRA